MSETNLAKLPTFESKSKILNIVIETPKGSRIKLKYGEEHKLFRAEKPLPVGLIFPFDFGFLPSTLGDDGDPLDVLVLSEIGLPFGCVVLGRILAVLKCEQSENGRKERNDRIIALPLNAKTRGPMQPLVELDSNLKNAIGQFFTKYNELEGKKFRLLGIEGSSSALSVIQLGIKAAKKANQTPD
jgi:inorganic pyrophosphatase